MKHARAIKFDYVKSLAVIMTSCILQHRRTSTGEKLSAIVILTPCESIRWYLLCKLSMTATAHVKVFRFHHQISSVGKCPCSNTGILILGTQDCFRGRGASSIGGL